MKTKISTLTGSALDWSVARAAGVNVEVVDYGNTIGVRTTDSKNYGNQYQPSSDWSHCGPLIAEHRIYVEPRGDISRASTNHPKNGVNYEYGPTPQIAICRAVVASVLGDEVELPEGLR